MSEIRTHHRNAATVLRKGKLADPFFPSRYRISPYIACAHACTYCDGRSERYFVEGDFERDIIVRTGIVERLAGEIAKLREPGTICIGSGITDPYQPVEESELVMRGVAEILADCGHPASVMTKSTLIDRDVELWSTVQEKAGFTLMVSMSTIDDGLAGKLEPGAASATERLALLRRFKDRGMHTGLLLMPIIPLLSDSREALIAIADAAKAAEVDFVLCGTLTLRPGRQKEFFMKFLAENFPDMVEGYENLYAEERKSGAPLSDYTCKVYKTIADLLAQRGIPLEVPHSVYGRQFASYDEIFILLHHLRTLYQARDIDTTPLVEVTRRYAAWLEEKRAGWIRKRSVDHSFMENLLAESLTDGTLAEVLQNDKTLALLQQVVLHGRQFDYVRLALTPY